MCCKDGILFWCKIFVKVVDLYSFNEGIIWIMEDVSDECMVQDVLCQLIVELVSIFESVLIGIVVVCYGYVFCCNGWFEEMFGYVDGFVVGMLVCMLFLSQDEFVEVCQIFCIVLYMGSICCYEWMLCCQNGQVFWVCISGCVFDLLQVEVGLVWLVEDIIDQKIVVVWVQQVFDEQNMIFENVVVGIMFLCNCVL